MSWLSAPLGTWGCLMPLPALLRVCIDAAANLSHLQSQTLPLNSPCHTWVTASAERWSSVTLEMDVFLNFPLCLFTINVTECVHSCHLQKCFHGGDSSGGSSNPAPGIHIPKGSGMSWWKLHLNPTSTGYLNWAPENRLVAFPISLPSLGHGEGRGGKLSRSILPVKPGLSLLWFDLLWFGLPRGKKADQGAESLHIWSPSSLANVNGLTYKSHIKTSNLPWT